MDLDFKEFENKSLLYAYLHEQLRLIFAVILASFMESELT